MKYAKFIDNYTIEYVNPKRLVLENKQIFNPKENDFISNGFYPLVESKIPEDELTDDQYWIPKYTFKNNKIKQTWIVKEESPIQS